MSRRRKVTDNNFFDPRRLTQDRLIFICLAANNIRIHTGTANILANFIDD